MIEKGVPVDKPLPAHQKLRPHRHSPKRNRNTRSRFSIRGSGQPRL